MQLQLEVTSEPVVLSQPDHAPAQVHVFDELSVWAVNAALAAKRPLLVRGEPGVGKTQLAEAVATVLRLPLVTHVVDSQTEPRDLLWQYDAVQRLAEAQIVGAMSSSEEALSRLDVRHFVRPGPVWWALDWQAAADQAARLRMTAPVTPNAWQPADGCVLLIDEIDKAESDVPNGLLQALGASRFQPEGFSEPVHARGRTSLVIVTTNEERVLPDAFLRRCLVLDLSLPTDESELTELLIQRGRAHFPEASAEILKTAAEVLVRDRRAAIERQSTPLPGQAEYLDLLRAVIDIASTDPDEQNRVLERVSRFVLDKTSGRGR